MSTTIASSKVSSSSSKKLSKHTTLKAASSVSVEESISVTTTAAEQQQAITDSSSGGACETIQKSSKITKKKSTAIATAASVSKNEMQSTKIMETIHAATETVTSTTSDLTSSSAEVTISHDNQGMNGKKKLKSKKNKKSDTDKQNISVKSSFSKFDALQKRNLIHVRSSDAGKAQEKFSNPQGEKEINCRLCSKPVYKMEEIKAEKSIFHMNCFRCHECNKQLKVDNYQSHEGVLYCMVHFKLIFAPKCVEENEPEKPRKPELIIRENQPDELPPDVVRASDKPSLGLEELQQLNVRSRFQVFEKGFQQKPVEQNEERTVKRSTSILTKLAKLQALGVSTDVNVKDYAIDELSGSENDADSDIDEDGDDDIDLVRSRKSTQRERPVGIGNAMNDIKTKFESGHMMSKEERREERKQEIQNIRSRLFLGKQARIKEMYQQAVADSEQAIISTDKKLEIETEGTARSLKERFEKGEMFKDPHADSERETPRTGGIQDEADVFESAISKKSRCIFMELDANVVAGKNQASSTIAEKMQSQGSRTSLFKRTNSENEPENIVKCDDKAEDVQVETSELSNKFKFFETYRPTESRKKEFRITPPREGVVKMPTPDSDTEADLANTSGDTNTLVKSNTTSIMLNKFREMERHKNHSTNAELRPLKCFTPPPYEGERVYQDQDSDLDSQDEDGDEEEEDDEDCEDERYRRPKQHENDEALKEAQAAARAKQLRAKFEKWEANEVQREMNEGRVDIYSQEVSDDTTIESTKSIRERFENMKNSESKAPTTPRYQVKRFV